MVLLNLKKKGRTSQQYDDSYVSDCLLVWIYLISDLFNPFASLTFLINVSSVYLLKIPHFQRYGNVTLD